jgi:MraZ protein
MLLGEFHSTADRERLGVPAPLRPELAAGLTLTRGIERCLWGLPAQLWEELTAKMRERLPLTDPAARSFARLIYASALPCAPAEDGSIPLPEDLRQYAGIEDEAVWVGLGDHVEIWNPQLWHQNRAQLDQSGPEVAGKLLHYGI